MESDFWMKRIHKPVGNKWHAAPTSRLVWELSGPLPALGLNWRAAASMIDVKPGQF